MADPLEVLLADGIVEEVLGRLKSGKEADISLVRHRGEVVAAKVYKDRATRSFKNNVEYKEGRKVRNTRTQRSMDSGGKFGRDAAEEAWKSAEVDALYRLAGTGVRIPRPVLFYEGVLLMELVMDDEGRPAPRLIDVALDPAAAGKVFADLRGQIVAMLCCDLIHGDLSPYNVLAAAAGPTIIDFPQVIGAAHSSRAEFFFDRDFQNILRYAAEFDPTLAVKHAGDARAIWRAYVARELTPSFVPPPPRPPMRTDRRPDARAGQRPDPRSSARPDPRGFQPRPDPRGPQRPDARAPQRPDARGPQRPDVRGPQRPDGRAPQRPDGRAPTRTEPPAQPKPDLRTPPRADLRTPRTTTEQPRRPPPPQRAAPAPPPAGGHRRRPKRRW